VRDARPNTCLQVAIERLNRVDADALGPDDSTPLTELATATDKGRRDAPWIAVCEI
jgi:hypothetical protein